MSSAFVSAWLSLLIFFSASGNLALADTTRIVAIDTHIVHDLMLMRDEVYLIGNEVHVLSGVTVTAEDGVTVLIRNGKTSGKYLHRAALIFDTGSRLDAEGLYFRAADEMGRVQRLADNGGLWFLGSYKEAKKDGVPVHLSAGTRRSRFLAQQIFASYLGRIDPDSAEDDIDGVSVLGVNKAEWKIAGVFSEFSGDDGFDVTNSRLRIESLWIRAPREDALNISSSLVEIERELTVRMTKSQGHDRHIFDLEVDDGPSTVLMEKACRLDLTGYFGNELHLRSEDMPQPNFEYPELYQFQGDLRLGPGKVYSIDED